MDEYRKHLKSIKERMSTSRKRRKTVKISDQEDIDGYHGFHSLKNTSFTTLTETKYSAKLLLREIALLAGAH
jgi:hypothetical protein